MNNATILAANPYDQGPPFWRRHSQGLAALAVFLITGLLTVLSFPPLEVPPVAYAFAAPAIVWAYRRPPIRLYALSVLGSQVVAWTILLGWLHNVSWLALLLGPVVGLWVGSWFMAVRWVAPRIPGNPLLIRLCAVLGLAGCWVLVEWSRTWLLSGFPWLPLAASQWQRPAILQIAAFTGAGGISFVLIAMNIGFAAYAHRLCFEGATGLHRRSQEFFATMFLLLVCLSIHVQETFNRGLYNVPLGRFAIVQPDVPQEVKWDPARGPGILNILERVTLSVAERKPDLILWPEAVTPWAVRGDESVRTWTESLVRRADVPLILGSIAVERDGPEETWYNGAFMVDPDEGLREGYYAKRHLVPFGEFVPFRPLLGWIDKFVPIGGDFQPGTSTAPFIVSTRNQTFIAAPLICYEDIFPQLARASVRTGADVLLVLTNNGWFGEGGAAYQHASHSVLRAIETRRPVIRAGNAGWSGWIDEFGSVPAGLKQVTRLNSDGTTREVVSIQPNEEGSIYFRGATTIDVTRDARWIGKESFYVTHGDWFVLLCAALFALAVAFLRMADVTRASQPVVPSTRGDVDTPSDKLS